MKTIADLKRKVVIGTWLVLDKFTTDGKDAPHRYLNVPRCVITAQTDRFVCTTTGTANVPKQSISHCDWPRKKEFSSDADGEGFGITRSNVYLHYRIVGKSNAPTHGNTNELSKRDKEVIAQGLGILERHGKKTGRFFTKPDTAATYVKLKIGGDRKENFMVIYLDNQHRLIESVIHFTGTIDGSQVHPREIVRHAMLVDAAALILAHNHPSGNTEPSDSDHGITTQIVDAMKTVSVRVLDHVIVSTEQHVSFAERGHI